MVKLARIFAGLALAAATLAIHAPLLMAVEKPRDPDPRGVLRKRGFFPIEADVPAEGTARARTPAPVAHATDQELHFSDQTSMRGGVESLDTARQEVVWRRAGVSGPLVFPMPEVSRVMLSPQSGQASKLHATVKFSGGDWIVADVVGFDAGKVALKLGDGTPLSVERARVEWIYFSKGEAAECYDGPTSMAGWLTQGNWTYRDGALRAATPGPIARNIGALPDRAEYLVELEQRDLMWSFNMIFHANDAINQGIGPGYLQLTMRGNELRLWSQVGNDMRNQTVDLKQALRAPGELGGGFKPERLSRMQLRIFEDHVAGRIVVFVDGRKAADWWIAPGKAGGNRGGFSFQPLVWNATSETIALSRFRVIPWDGTLPKETVPPDRSSVDRIGLESAEAREGRIESFNGGKFRLRSAQGIAEIPREKVTLVRFARPDRVPDEQPALARISLAEGGAFDAANVVLRDGRVLIRADFASDFSIPEALVREVEFVRSSWTSPNPSDSLVFKDGDRLRGFLDTVGGGPKMHWRLAKGDAGVEVDITRVAGVMMADRADKKRLAVGSNVIARFRNGDSMAGNFVTLDGEQLILDAPNLGQLHIARRHVQSLYFARAGVLPVFDGVSSREDWLTGFENNGVPAANSRNRRSAMPLRSREWKYFDGSFSLPPVKANEVRNGNFASPTLGRVFASLPDRVELSFDVTSQPGTPVFFSLQLFTEAAETGYMLQIQPQGIAFYDMRNQGRGRGVAPQQIQMQFSEKVSRSADRHRMQILADRTTGRVSVVVDGELVGQAGRNPADIAIMSGRGVFLLAQPNMPCTFTNLWLGPWNGRVPGKSPAPLPDAPDTVFLANGDEASGRVTVATPTIVKVEGDLGKIELPVERLTMIDFGGQITRPTSLSRVHLAGRGTVTLLSWRVEKDTVVCRTEIAGEIRIPMVAVRELVLAPVMAR